MTFGATFATMYRREAVRQSRQVARKLPEKRGAATSTRSDAAPATVTAPKKTPQKRTSIWDDIDLDVGYIFFIFV
jgi:hypothetical protein